ncbi:MFS transporter [Dictyobacter formicarum]|uniref:MFS transporter n=2 Tax=Dictyobacter formicarum TaxID=2778368 RepID=A0ABQ3VDT0_9CHLR|nr:MFS transporter [Dictyobacter formicarum]
MLLWSGQLVSWIGTEVSGIALPLVVLALTGSSAQAGAVAAIRGLVYVCWAIPAGVLIDRWNRKIVMVIANLGSGLAMGSIALALAFHSLSVIQLYIISAIEGSFFVFANLGRFASFPKVVSKEQFPAASAQSGTADHIALLVGPPLGGLLYQAAGGFIAFFVDSLSYFINAFSIFFINIPLGTKTPTERKAVHHEIKEAIVWFWHQPLLRFLNLLTAGRIILSAGLYLLIIVLAKEHHASSLFIGAIFAIGAGGGILGSFISAKIHSRFGMKQLLLGVLLLSFLIFSLYAIAINNFLLAGITALFYAADPLYNVTISSYSVKIVPDEMRGRVASLTRLIDLGANSFGFFITGDLLQYLGSRWTIGVFALMLLLLFIATEKNRNLAATKM